MWRTGRGRGFEDHKWGAWTVLANLKECIGMVRFDEKVCGRGVRWDSMHEICNEYA